MNELKQSEVSVSNSSTQQIVVFKLGNEEYGLKIDQIKEVVITPAITKMPQTPSYMKGVANIRGNVIAILDLEEKFSLANQTETRSAGANFTLVIESRTRCPFHLQTSRPLSSTEINRMIPISPVSSSSTKGSSL